MSDMRPGTWRDSETRTIAAIVVFVIIVLAAGIAIIALSGRNTDQTGAIVESEATPTPTPVPTDVTPGPTPPSDAPATATAVTAPTQSETIGSQPSPGADSTPVLIPAEALLALLPQPEDIAPQMVLVSERPLSIEEAAQAHPDPSAEEERLRGWGFQQAIIREYALPPEDVATDAERMTRFIAVVIEFATPEGSRQAVESHRRDVSGADDADIEHVQIAPIGDFAVAARGEVTLEGERLRVALIGVQQQTNALYFFGVSPEHDTFDDVERIAREVITAND